MPSRRLHRSIRLSIRPLPALLLAGLCGPALPAHAASTAPMEVSSTITPAACTPTLSGGGVANYGVMNVSMLQAGRPTPLPVKTLNFAVNCEVPARFAVRLIDNRASSLVPGIVAQGAGDTTLNDDYNFGLGTSSGRNVGGYVIRFGSASYTGDYQPAQLLVSTDGSHWRAWNSGLGSKRQQLAWGPPDDNAVRAYKAVSGELSVQAFINRPENLTLSQDVVLDGAATLELVYL